MATSLASGGGMGRRIAIGLALSLAHFGCGDNETGPAPADAGVDAGDGGAAITQLNGLSINLENATIGSDRRVSVDFTASDGSGVGLTTLNGLTTSWTVATAVAQDPATGQPAWRSDHTTTAKGAFGTVDQPASDSKGTYQNLGGDRFRYTFSFPLPDGDDPAATHRVALFSRAPTTPGLTADVTSDTGSFAVANAALDWVPSGGAPTPPDEVITDACNRCHAPLQAHGGFRRDVRLCLTCHTSQLADPDSQDPALPGQPNALDFKVMIHRIHDGTSLPTLVAAQAAGIVGATYEVIGYQGNASVFAETVPPLLGQKQPQITGVAFPQDIRNCTVCHQGTPASGEFVNRPTRHACTSCHDATWFGDPAAVPALHHQHPGDAQASDAVCTKCHVPTGTEFDLSVTGSHVVPLQSKQLQGLTFEIVSVQGAAGTNPVVQFRITSGGQPVTDLAQFDSLSLVVSGPTTDYVQANNDRQDVRKSVLNADRTFTFAFPPRAATGVLIAGEPVIPPDAKGTFAVGMEGRRKVNLTGDGSVEESAFNPVAYFSVDGSPIVKRRAVVEQARCDKCHQALSMHGGLRHNVEYCVVCHGPDLTDWAQRPKGPDKNVDLAATADGIEERSVHFKMLIHRIHTGENLEVTQPFVIYGFGSTPGAFGDIRFPGDRRRCNTCHGDTTFTVNAIPATALPTIANETGKVMHQGTAAHVPGEPEYPPIQAACLSCHDSPAAHAHVQLNTVAGTEACPVCHGEGRDDSVTSRHIVQQ